MITTQLQARSLARDLMTNGAGQTGERLVLQDAEGRGLGGWSERALVTWLAAQLDETLRDQSISRERIACEVLGAVLRSTDLGEGIDRLAFHRIAADAVELADALLAALARPRGNV